ncbi:AAA family ATPase [Bilifractor sp. LCP21S3_A7]|uniref:cytidylate kinase-like family protein n=1 Tax=Bilifractor sp. LCP21S3_A7 TaxID=3438738 RepID=UPI003F8EB64B
MKHFIINISREFGCNAREVSRQLASMLNVEIYDKDLIDLTARRAGINQDSFLDSDAIVDKSRKNLLQRFGYGSSTSFYSDEAIKAQADIIRELANKGSSCIFFGRCSDYILREYPNRLNILLYAPFEQRVLHVMRNYNLDEVSAKKLITRVDRQRHNYYKYVTGKNRGDRDYKQLMIDVHEFGIKGSATLLYDVIVKHFHD